MSSSRIVDLWGDRTPYSAGQEWPARVDEHLIAEPDTWVPSASLLHSNGDAMDIGVRDGRIVGVRGRAADRVNHGRLDVKDLYGWQANHAADRLHRPLIRRDGELVETDWDTAMEAVAGTCRHVLDMSGPSGVGFYTTGQLFAEEYYTLTTIARAGIGTNHLDGNTRLCTATAAEALKETFGCDGQPASYTDVDHAEVIGLFGHNVAETQSVLWMRMLDRLAGPTPPQLVVVDPRRTQVAEHATVHLAPRPGTNLALLNALLRELVAHDWVNHAWVDAHTVGYDELVKVLDPCTPQWAAGICDLDAADIERAAEIFGKAERLLATVLQGVYQSHQATATAVQINNLVLLRGSLGKPGCGVLQMNGQPTAQNTRECGANGDLPGFRNWQNDDHVEQLAEIWNVELERIPHFAPPTPALQIFRYAEQGSINFLWISGTNPAVSLPELSRIRSILASDNVFVVVQDIFRTETAEFADVVLPAATWAEKTGVFTNADRTVHLSDKAIDPPGEAKPDLDIFLDFAARMRFTDKHGAPLITWADAESAFKAWQRCSAGRPCDYSGLSYKLLRERGGIQWPCNDSAPEGTERLYSDATFWATASECETYGRDLVTGASVHKIEYEALNPHGRALLKGAEYLPLHDPPDEDFPLFLTTGRTIYHFHTRTKTARAPELDAAAPEVWVELSASDAATLQITEGEPVLVRTPRGSVRGLARITQVRTGTIFVPFHYGYWDTKHPDGSSPYRAANEMTPTDWDPVSKQPLFKLSRARVEKVNDDA